MTLSKIFLYYWKSISLITFILYLSFAPPSTFNGVPSFAYEDKVVHIFLYSVLTCFLIFDYRKYAKKNKTNTWLFALICLAFPIIIGGSVEILQPTFFAPRTAEWLDLFSDITGVTIGWLCMKFLIKQKN